MSFGGAPKPLLHYVETDLGMIAYGFVGDGEPNCAETECACKGVRTYLRETDPIECGNYDFYIRMNVAIIAPRAEALGCGYGLGGIESLISRRISSD